VGKFSHFRWSPISEKKGLLWLKCPRRRSLVIWVKSGVNMKLSTEFWWNFTKGGKPKYREKKNVTLLAVNLHYM
jgi:hypothetical protein